MDIGLIWDKYDGRLKAQILNDLLALAQAGLERVQIKAPEGEDVSWLEPMLRLVNVKRVDALLPVQWRCYIVENEPEMPECCEDWMVKDLRIQKSRGVPFRQNETFYPSLERMSDNRVVPPGLSMMLNKRPPVRPSGNQGVVLPQNFFYSPFI